MSGDTWQAMCHNAWQRHTCVTHGMPCVNMHGNLEGYKRGVPIQFGGGGGGGQASVRGSNKEKEEEGKREREERKREREERKEEREEEKRRRNGRKKGKRKRKRKECCIVSRPGRQRTRNCAARGRFPPTLVILLLGAT